MKKWYRLGFSSLLILVTGLIFLMGPAAIAHGQMQPEPIHQQAFHRAHKDQLIVTPDGRLISPKDQHEQPQKLDVKKPQARPKVVTESYIPKNNWQLVDLSTGAYTWPVQVALYTFVIATISLVAWILYRVG
ncbi:hypothetical protein [Levilactobacillus bambusae]|uniref:Uncharacterized protein n=1 Tax=Levilactobacillus bambusae TaxID=2024736 RepID=A0A2V1MXV2_9LACO|nr:hypothetical protein [Levilactobacillus bambusae]PWF99828.1 hypothetical protein DCM90_07145 [Levilactobacillus bambusae]